MNIDIVSCQDRERWMEAFDRLPDDEKDIHWLPEYVEAHRQHRKGFAYIVEDGEDASIIPFVADGNSVASPYGYGGLIGGGPFGLPVSASYRCHPLFGEQLGKLEKHVVVIDLDCDDLRARLSKGHKSAVRRAENRGFYASPVNQKPFVFSPMYDFTMERQGANPSWRLTDKYFKNLCDLMGMSAQFFECTCGSTDLESMSIILHGFNAAYYHFAASYANYPKSGANHLMVLRVAEWAKEQGYRWLHLGGSVTAASDDPLLIFKKGFGGRLVPVHRYNGGPDGTQAH